MTIEEAIKELEPYVFTDEELTPTIRRYSEALSMAIEALEDIERWRTWSHTYDNIISRQDAIDILDDFEADIELGERDSYKTHREKLLSLPSAKSTGDLISIQMAIEHWGRSSGNLTNGQIAELQREVESLPSADAVEVVRCKDCRHSRIEGDTTLFMWCGYWNKPTDGNRYCSDGERREP